MTKLQMKADAKLKVVWQPREAFGKADKIVPYV
jgi:hypothetical protein